MTRTGVLTSGCLSKAASAFMIDLSQVSMMLRGATARSLLILDEFGKGQNLFSNFSPIALDTMNRHSDARWSRPPHRNSDRVPEPRCRLSQDRKLDPCLIMSFPCRPNLSAVAQIAITHFQCANLIKGELPRSLTRASSQRDFSEAHRWHGFIAVRLADEDSFSNY